MTGGALPSPEFWSGRRVLVTGHTGFKGAWLVRWLSRLGAHVHGLALDPDPNQQAAARALPVLEADWRVDLRSHDKVAEVVAEVEPEIILHLAAQAMVRQGYRDPVATYDVNVVGTSALLEPVARLAVKPAAVIVVTSDKVYANDGSGRAFEEVDPLGGSDPYSLSKALAEQVITEWRKRNPGIRIATARAGNVIGGGDRGDDRLLVDVSDALLSDHVITLRNPSAVRPWQHVLEAVRGYLLYAEGLAADHTTAEAINFGPPFGQRTPVSEVVDMALEAWGSGRWTTDESVNPPEAPTLSLAPDRAAESLGWRTELSLREGVAWTAEWWRDRAAGVAASEIMDRQIERYEERLA